MKHHLIILAALLQAPLGGLTADEPSKPNIILIFADVVSDDFYNTTYNIPRRPVPFSEVQRFVESFILKGIQIFERVNLERATVSRILFARSVVEPRGRSFI